MGTLLNQLHGANKNKLAVLKRLRKILDVGNGTKYEEIFAAGAAVADNVVPLLEAHAVKYLKLPAAKVIYLTLRGEHGLEEMSDETTHPILGRAALVAQALVKVLNQELTKGAQANANHVIYSELVWFAIAALDELTRAHSSVHAVAEAGAIVPCVELCGSTCTATLECAATILGHLAMNSLLPDGNVWGYWYEVYAAEAVPPLVKLLQHTKSDVVSQAARALRTLVEEAGTDDDDDGDALENILGAVRVALIAMQVTDTVLGVDLLLLQAAVQEAEQKVAQRNQPSQPEAQLEVQLEAPASNPVVVAAIASPAVATVAAAHTAPPVAPAAPVGSPHTAVIQLPRARANSHTVASRQKAAKQAAPPPKPPRTKQARHATATSPSQAVPPSIGVAPAAVPTPAEGLHQKMGRVKAELKLDPGLLLVDAIKAANELMGITPAAGTWLPVQVDLLLATIWGG